MEKTTKLKKTKMLSVGELAGFAEEMHQILRTGISAIEGITIMGEEAEDPAEKELLEAMKGTVIDTGSLSKAIKETGVFPNHFVEMTELGEQTGRTDEVMKDLCAYYRREASIRSAIRNAVSYPLLMIVMMSLVVIVLITKVMPIFERVFIQLGSQMTGISGGFLKLGNALRNYSVLFTLFIIVVIEIVIYLAKTERGRKRLMKFGYKISWVRRIYENTTASRFANALAIALKSGMGNEQALEMSKSLVNNPFFEKRLTACLEKVQEHELLSTALCDSGIFTGLYGRMIRMCERTGNVEEVLAKAAEAYQAEADEDIDGMISVVEPTLVILLSVVVGIILLSVMLPLLGIMSGIN